jgi:hypothetical protein
LQERKLGHYAALLDTVRRYRVCFDAAAGLEITAGPRQVSA